MGLKPLFNVLESVVVISRQLLRAISSSDFKFVFNNALKLVTLIQACVLSVRVFQCLFSAISPGVRRYQMGRFTRLGRATLLLVNFT